MNYVLKWQICWVNISRHSTKYDDNDDDDDDDDDDDNEENKNSVVYRVSWW